MRFETRALDVVDAARALTFAVEVLHPLAAQRLPLVMLSHGNGGAQALYRTLRTHLAAHGYVVASFDHPGNHRRDDRLAGTPQNLVDRPRHISLAIDALLADPDAATMIDAGRVAVVGHSLGGYTALALAGGRATTRDGEDLPAATDPRVRALVLLAPAAFFFTAPGALADVDLPTLLLEAEHDAHTPASQGKRILDGVADRSKVVSRSIAGAGHFSFLDPFPPAMRRPSFAPANDPEGFDREAFHRVWPDEVRAFLDRALPPPSLSTPVPIA